MTAAVDVFVMPASFYQERLWLLDRLDPGSPVYNLPAAVRLRGDLDVAALRWALQEIVGRHEVLRTSFGTEQGCTVQVIHPSRTIPFEHADLSARPAAEREAELASLRSREARQAFDLVSGALCRAVLATLAPGDHELLLTMHHIVADGWSIGILMRELSALYAARVQGRDPELPALPIQYADYAVWQRQRSEDGGFDQQIDYWRRRLAGLSQARLVTPDGITGRGPALPDELHVEELGTTLGAELSDRIRELGRRERVTPFMTLLAALATLLHRHAGIDDLALGVPIAGRGRAETRDLIGMFLNILVLRADLSGAPSHRQVLARVKRVAAEAYEHQEVPFERLVEELRPDRGFRRSPFFQVFFNMLSYPAGSLDLPGLAVEFVAPRDGGAKFDLTVYADDRDERIDLRWVYDSELFGRARMEDLLGQYRQVLEDMVEHGDRRIDEVPLVTAAARRLLPEPARPLDDGWNGSLHDRLARWAAREPDRVAVVDSRGATTFFELDERTSRLARRLCAVGVGRGDLVAVHAHRSAGLVEAILGVLKAGAAYTLLDPAHPGSRLRDQLERARVSAWIAVAGAGPPAPEVVELLGPLPVLSAPAAPKSAGGPEEAAPFAVAVEGDDLAVVTFTSGSTGRPKGILGRHGPLTHFQPWQGERFGLGDLDVYSLVSGLSHDPLQREIFTPLWFGATCAIPDPDRVLEPGWLADWMARQRVTVAHLTPAMSQLLCDTARPGLDLHDLRRVFLTGESLTRVHTDALAMRASRARLVNLYGATETQRAVGFFEVPRPARDGARAAAPAVWPAGRGMRDVQLLVVTRRGGLAGIGETGEIVVRSPHLARGYLEAPAATAERFAPNPAAAIGGRGERVYRTGDLGRYRSDGAIEYLGRFDDQVQIRGYRVEPAEVVRILEEHPGVRRAAVVARDDGRTGIGLGAYWTEGTRPPTDAELLAFCRRRLPPWMVPSSFTRLEMLPLTASGKLDRAALPEPERPRPLAVGPRTPEEELLAAHWRQVLGVDRVEPEDDFFALGGHSLLATQLVSRLRTSLGVEIPLRTILEAPTLADQARSIALARAGADAPGAPPLRPMPRGGPLPLSYAQQRLWFLHRMEPESPFYNLPAVLRLDGPLDRRALSRSLDEIVARHEVLRTTFAETGGRAVQVIGTPVHLPLPVIDLGALPAARAQGVADELLAQEAARPFDLQAEAPIRAGLLSLGAERHLALVTLHHVAGDLWSSAVFHGEVVERYRALLERRAPRLPALPVQYADFAVCQREWLSGDALERHLSYWEGQLRGAPPVLDLPGDRPRPPRPSFRGGVTCSSLSGDLAARVESLATSRGVTPFMTLLSAFAVLLHHETGRIDVVVGTDVANRTRQEVEGLIGFFVNQLVLRLDLSGDPSFDEILRRARDVALGAYAHQDVPFDKVVERLAPERNPAYAPVFQVKLNLQNVPRPQTCVPGLEIERVAPARSTSQFDLILNLSREESGFQLRLEYSRDLFEPVTAGDLLARYTFLLHAAVERPEARLRELCQDLLESERSLRKERHARLRGESVRRLRSAARGGVTVTTGEPAASEPGRRRASQLGPGGRSQA